MKERLITIGRWIVVVPTFLSVLILGGFILYLFVLIFNSPHGDISVLWFKCIVYVSAAYASIISSSMVAPRGKYAVAVSISSVSSAFIIMLTLLGVRLGVYQNSKSGLLMEYVEVISQDLTLIIGMVAGCVYVYHHLKSEN
jgi:signal transduction histidine kinase